MLKAEEGGGSRCYGIRAGQSLGSFDRGAFPGDDWLLWGPPADIWRRLLNIGYKRTLGVVAVVGYLLRELH